MTLFRGGLGAIYRWVWTWDGVTLVMGDWGGAVCLSVLKEYIRDTFNKSRGL